MPAIKLQNFLADLFALPPSDSPHERSKQSRTCMRSRFIAVVRPIGVVGG
jgi:hypothetical protein